MATITNASMTAKKPCSILRDLPSGFCIVGLGFLEVLFAFSAISISP
jgi:hypothetical protein